LPGRVLRRGKPVERLGLSPTAQTSSGRSRTLVLLEGPVDYWPESHKCVRALYPLVLELGRPVDARPVDIRQYEAQEWPLYQEAKREGVTA